MDDSKKSENTYIIENRHLSEQAAKRKHALETDPSVRTNHMEYMKGMEIINSDVCKKVMSEVEGYDCRSYTAKDVI